MSREILIINDVHLGVRRSAGTTPQSAIELRTWLQMQLREFIMQHLDKDIIFNGDVFDEFLVPMQDLLMFYHTACAWLGHSKGGKIWIVPGNHDVAKDSARMSALHTVAQILTFQYPSQAVLVAEPAMITDGVYVVPHLPNQQMLDEAIAAVPQEAHTVLFHANYNNGFAAVQDHSLNVSEEQAERLIHGNPDGLTSPGRLLIFGHEHQFRLPMGKHVLVTGNQWPSSIADCLRNPRGKKYAHVLGGKHFEADQIETWDAAEYFLDIDWDDISLMDAAAAVPFVRVSGTAKAEQAADVIATISKLRQSSKAYVITNAVKVEGVQDMEELPESIEMTKQFDVMAYLLEQLTIEQAEVVRKLVAGKEQEAA